MLPMANAAETPAKAFGILAEAAYATAEERFTRKRRIDSMSNFQHKLSSDQPIELANHYLNNCADLRESLGIPAGIPLEARPLGQGEHNANFTFANPQTNKLMVLRINYASQLGLEKQSSYEFAALRALQPSGRVPRGLFLDDSKAIIDNGVMVMEHVAGEWLDFERKEDLVAAAHMLADVHAVQPDEQCGLLRANDPLRDQFENCQRMFANYKGSAFEDAMVVGYVERFFDRAETVLNTSTCSQTDCMHILNTEAVNSHFLIPRENDRGDDGAAPSNCASDTGSTSLAGSASPAGWLIDWEKPIIGEVAQDIAYFLSPTTTIWDTDFIFSETDRNEFVRNYWSAVDGRFAPGNFEERFHAYVMMNCLVGITWSCNALVEYHDPARPLKNEKTLHKLGTYLSEDFLKLCERICYHS